MYSRYNYNGRSCVNGFLFVRNVNSDELLTQIVEDAKRECFQKTTGNTGTCHGEKEF